MRVYRRGYNAVEGQFEHHGKGRVYTDADGWHKKPLGAECSTEIPGTNVRPISIAHNQDLHIHAGASGMTKKGPSANNEGESLVQIVDSNDTQAQVMYCLNTFLSSVNNTFDVHNSMYYTSVQRTKS